MTLYKYVILKILKVQTTVRQISRLNNWDQYWAYDMKTIKAKKI